MDDRAQGALEYLLLIGGALIVAAVVIVLALGFMQGGANVSHTAGTGAIRAVNNAAIHNLP